MCLDFACVFRLVVVIGFVEMWCSCFEEFGFDCVGVGNEIGGLESGGKKCREEIMLIWFIKLIM